MAAELISESATDRFYTKSGGPSRQIWEPPVFPWAYAARVWREARVPFEAYSRG